MFGMRARVHDVPVFGDKSTGATYHSLIDWLFAPQYPDFKGKINRLTNPLTYDARAQLCSVFALKWGEMGVGSRLAVFVCPQDRDIVVKPYVNPLIAWPVPNPGKCGTDLTGTTDSNYFPTGLPCEVIF